MRKGFICPTCGCSLIRLGLNVNKVPFLMFHEEKFYFCCEECKNIFLKDPNRYIIEIEDKFVCPVCLGEKHKSEGISFEYEGKEIFFCRCPHCLDTFKNNPEFFIKRLEGRYDNKILKFGAD